MELGGLGYLTKDTAIGNTGWKANRKLYPGFQMVPLSMTLNDL